MANKYYITEGGKQVDLTTKISTATDTTLIKYNRGNLGFTNDSDLDKAIVHYDYGIGIPAKHITDLYYYNNHSNSWGYFIDPSKCNIATTVNSDHIEWNSNSEVAWIAGNGRCSGVTGALDTVYRSCMILTRTTEVIFQDGTSHQLSSGLKSLYLMNGQRFGSISKNDEGDDTIYYVQINGTSWTLDHDPISSNSDILGVIITGAGGGGGASKWAAFNTRTGGSGGGGGGCIIGYLDTSSLSTDAMDFSDICNALTGAKSELSCFVVQAGAPGSGGTAPQGNGTAGGQSYIAYPSYEQAIMANGGDGGFGMLKDQSNNTASINGGVGGIAGCTEDFIEFTYLTSASGSAGRAGYVENTTNCTKSSNAVSARTNIPQNGYTITKFYGYAGQSPENNKTGGPGGVSLTGWGLGGRGGNCNLGGEDGRWGDRGMIELYQFTT